MIELSVSDGRDDERADAVRALSDAVMAQDGSAPLSERFLLNLRYPRAAVQHILATDPVGTLVGYAQLDRPDTGAGPAGELAVHPGHRRRGIGTTLVEALIERAGPEQAGGPLRLWAHGEHPGAIRLAERLGFTRDRVLWQLHRDLTEPLPDVELAGGVWLRPFVVGQDEAAFLRVNNAAFKRHPEQGGWNATQLAQREAEPWFDPQGFLLAVDADPGAGTDGAGSVLGYHWTKAHPATAATGPIGEVYVLGVDPAAQGRGLGRALTVAGLHHLRRQGLSQVMLYVQADNDAAVRVYRDLGFTQWHTDVVYRR